jgi:hypothetical protein
MGKLEICYLYFRLWDNLENEQILKIINVNSTNGKLKSEVLALDLAQEAEKLSNDK